VIGQTVSHDRILEKHDPLFASIRSTPELAAIQKLAIDKQKAMVAARSGHKD